MTSRSIFRRMHTRSWAGLCIFLGLVGCTSTESQCETLCDWLDRCSGENVDCSQSEIDDCVDEIDDESDDCQDAFDEFVDCVDDNESCSSVERECVGEAVEVAEQCE